LRELLGWGRASVGETVGGRGAKGGGSVGRGGKESAGGCCARLASLAYYKSRRALHLSDDRDIVKRVLVEFTITSLSEFRSWEDVLLTRYWC